MDSFSGDAEVPIKEATQKTTKETVGVERSNLLSVLNLEYSKLPDSFSVNNGLLSGFELLKKETSEKKVEIGGILARDNKNELKIRTISPTEDSSANIVKIDCISVNEKNIEGPLYWESKSTDVNKNGHDIYIVNSELANKYRHFFEKLIKNGRQVLIDNSLIARIHSHPSGNLPSPGDFDHVLIKSVWSGDGNTAKPEIVATKDWIYFLIPTNQTPDLSSDTPTEKAIIGGPDRFIRQCDEEDMVVDHIMTNAEKGNQERALNAVRLKNLTDKCLKYNVGFYTLAKGESVAKRIV